MFRRITSVAVLAFAFVSVSFAQVQAAVQNEEMQLVLDQIREEGFQRSQVMEIVHHLTDQFGPRLTGSPSLEEAGQWSLDYLGGKGLTNLSQEGWNWGNNGWENERLDVHMISPSFEPMIAEVLAWTPSTNGVIRSAVVQIVPPENSSPAELTSYLQSVSKQVQGKIVLVGSGAIVTSEDAGFGLITQRERDQIVATFLLENGALVQVNPSGMEDGLIRAFANRTFDSRKAIPTLILRTEDYGRMTRLIAHDTPVEMEIFIDNYEYPAGKTAYNYTADITGSDKSKEIVMLGGHLDSWHAATGATDNAAGSAIMIEAVRILKSLGLNPRRTIRLALWTGEEQGLLGSQAYIAKHFGTNENRKADFDQFGGYINVDTGTGRLVGASVFGPPAAEEYLNAMLGPLEGVGSLTAGATDSRKIGGSDHTAFNHVGLPGISMIQDPVRYQTHTWHTNIDTYEQLLPADLKQAAVVVASTIYQMAMVEDSLPRFPKSSMPAPISGQ